MNEFFLLFFLLSLSLLLVIISAEISNRSCGKIAAGLNLPKYIIGFFVVAIISILPEAFIAITSAFKGIPSLGIGTLFGSNVADLTIVFAFVVLAAGRGLNVQSKIIKNSLLYIALIALPIIFGFNGRYTRTEGFVLVLAGTVFFFYILQRERLRKKCSKFPALSLIILILSMTLLLIGADLTVKYALELAQFAQVRPVLIGMFIVGLGTTLPELLFSIRAAQRKNDSLALGDILGTVIADATILVGIMVLIKPFEFNPMIARITGVFMVAAIILLFYFLKSGKKLSRGEAILLILFYCAFIAAEIIVSR